MESGCILWGSRVIVPKVGQESVLDMLHERHPGRGILVGTSGRGRRLNPSAWSSFNPGS